MTFGIAIGHLGSSKDFVSQAEFLGRDSVCGVAEVSSVGLVVESGGGSFLGLGFSHAL